MTASFQCASCGAQIDFSSGASVYAVCKYCNSAQIRTGASLSDLGKVAQLKEDYSAIQLGTQGVHPRLNNNSSTRFSTIGRIRLSWERGFWDEWYVLLENGEGAWLAEAQGFYYFSVLTNDVTASQLEFPLSIGNKYNLLNNEYNVKDIKSATCSYSEGELPFSGAVGEKYESYELFTVEGDFLSLSIVDNVLLAYKGQVFSLEELSLSNLRALEGWTLEKRAFNV